MSAAVMSLVAASSAPSAPYPRDTRAKGWRFELDYERIEQSDTWVLASAEMRPWLLMLWLTAWRQSPCGSLPATDELIAARIGMDVRQFAAHRDILMRGWWLADDGRMYHPVITEQVLGLIGVRAKDKARQDAHRAKRLIHDKSTTYDDLSRVTNAVSLVSQPLATTPEPEPEPEPKSIDRKAKVPAADAASKRGSRLPDDWVLPRAWGQWAVDDLGMSADAIRLEAAKFGDYWRAKSGRDATKADWLATWRNWCRNARPSKPGESSASDRFGSAI